jgi:Zn-dependent metalloprotease
MLREPGGQRPAGETGSIRPDDRQELERKKQMCQKKSHRHSIFCILPPHVLRSIARNGSAQERDHALRILAKATTYRTLRAVRLSAPALGIVPMAVAGGAKLNRTIFNGHSESDLPGEVVRSEGQAATGDAAVDEAYDGLGGTYNYYQEAFQRNSIDGRGMPMLATVHSEVNLDNAYWNGQQMVFGDGDNRFFNRFTISTDVIGHELTHGVTEHEAQLIYSHESGALNESMSDVFGSIVKQYMLGKQSASDADWLIGQGLFTPAVNGVALRSMKDPGSAFDDRVLGKDPQPGHMDQFVDTDEDNGGVHINSGIPNKAFYLVATAIGGFAGDKAGRIWYESLRDPRLRPDATFVQFARVTISTAERIYPGGTEQGIVRDAWDRVGVRVR